MLYRGRLFATHWAYRLAYTLYWLNVSIRLYDKVTMFNLRWLYRFFVSYTDHYQS